jgi:hypothetical protein
MKHILAEIHGNKIKKCHLQVNIGCGGLFEIFNPRVLLKMVGYFCQKFLDESFFLEYKNLSENFSAESDS